MDNLEIIKTEIVENVPAFLVPASCSDCFRCHDEQVNIVQIVANTYEDHHIEISGYCKQHKYLDGYRYLKEESNVTL